MRLVVLFVTDRLETVLITILPPITIYDVFEKLVGRYTVPSSK